MCAFLRRACMQATSLLTARTARAPHAIRSTIRAPFVTRKRAPQKRTLSRATTVAPPVDTPPSDVAMGMPDVEAAKEQIDWRQQWCAEYSDVYPQQMHISVPTIAKIVGIVRRYAVHPVESLPEDRPWPVTVLGRELVVWLDGGGQWRVFDDACPHRKVALSEGRKEADGTLACAYHGWRFDGVLLIMP